MSIIQRNTEKEQVVSAAPAERILLWLGWADKDYVAARRLLLNGYLQQGAALGNTGLEKYFKTLLIFVGKKFPRSHNVVKLHECSIAAFPNLGGINISCLEVLSQAYRLRYPDDLEVDFSVSLAQPKILTELDRTVHHVRQGLRFSRSSGRPIQTLLDMLIEAKDPDIIDSNCYFSTARRSDVFDRLTECYEMRILKLDQILEVRYRANVPDDGKFVLEGLRPSASDEENRQ